MDFNTCVYSSSSIYTWKQEGAVGDNWSDAINAGSRELRVLLALRRLLQKGARI